MLEDDARALVHGEPGHGSYGAVVVLQDEAVQSATVGIADGGLGAAVKRVGPLLRADGPKHGRLWHQASPWLGLAPAPEQ
ncbi:hypothetical protein [Streptomyces brasiliensis]|uniref:hypothetical protein n=1 Tax=Streptomyces brasiliensis TaxID=1954 RepID=UPI00167118D6|nr:hypothetical protein [Streptomyces brasiliensis]